MGMNFSSEDCCGGVLIGDGESFASGCGAAIEDAGCVLFSAADESGNELGSFVLNDDMAVAECMGSGDVSGLNAARGGENGSGLQRDAFRGQFAFGGCGAQANRRCGDLLIVFADATCGRCPVLLRPFFYQPVWMCIHCG